MQPEQSQPDQPTQPQQPVDQPVAEQWQQPQATSAEPHAYEGPAPEMGQIATAEVEAPLTPESVERTPLDGEDDAVRWQASEYIQRDKDAQWFIIFAIVVVLMLVLAIFVIDSWSFAALIVVMAATVVVMNKRPPMVHSYILSRKGLHIDDRLHPYSDFKEFGLVADDDEHSIMLIPRKRFRPGVTVYFPEEVGEGLVDMLAARLPMKQVHLDPIDKLVRFLHI